VRGTPGPRTCCWTRSLTRRTNGALTMDRDGAYAFAGVVDERALGELVAREAFYLALPPPKSTGRERFGAMLLDAHAELFAPLSLEDGCATLAALTVATICDSLSAYGPARARVIASGGGTQNAALMVMLRERLERAGSTLHT
jgi:anhydro-N-acetylmuramic acid kinase